MREFSLRAHRPHSEVVPDEHGNYVRTCARCGLRYIARKPPKGGSYVCADCKSCDPYFYRQARTGR